MIKNFYVSAEKNFVVNKRIIHDIVSKLSRDLNYSITDLHINFVGDKQIQRLNRHYLEHDYTTDVITFNYSEVPIKLNGEIFISISDAYENSKRFRVTLDKEILRLVIHGILHLLGYDDKEKDEKAIMKKLENKLVRKHFNLLTKSIVKYDNENC